MTKIEPLNLLEGKYRYNTDVTKRNIGNTPVEVTLATAYNLQVVAHMRALKLADILTYAFKPMPPG